MKKTFTAHQPSLLRLALVATMMLAVSARAEVVKPDGGNVVISKVFYAASKGAESGNYPYGQYIELFNNSTKDVDITGMYIGLIESEAAKTAYSVGNIAADEELKKKLNGKAVLKQLFQIPDDKTYTIESGKTVIICNSAIDHTALAKTGHDLSNADFEVKTTNAKYTHNDNVPAMKMVFSFNSSTDFMNLTYSGPAGIVLLKNDAKAVDLENKVFAYGKETGNQYVIANLYYCVDAVEILANTKNGVDETTKRISGTTYDAGYATTDATGTYNGETVYRKTAFVCSDGRTFLFDTGNSSTDFQASATIQPRQFETEIAGLSDETITIPESGYLLVQATKTFFGPRGVHFTYLTGNKKNPDITYNSFVGDMQLLDKSLWIAVGQPGTYTLKLSEAQPMQKVNSNLLTWCDEDSKTLTGGQATRSIYKFQNQKDNVGFQRVPATADGKYNVADFTDGNRLYITLTTDFANAFYAANGAASAEEFSFIPWHGPTPADVATGISSPRNITTHSPAIYNLSGQRLKTLHKGVNIVDGKKLVVK